MSTISDEIKTFIVMALARFDTPSQVVDAVKTNFGVEVSRQQVYGYDPKCSKPPAPRWQELHAATRRAYLREVAEIGIAQKAVRLAMLDRMAHHALANNYSLRAAAFLEQAARECGGTYEGRRHTTIVSLTAAPPIGRDTSGCEVAELDIRAITDQAPSGQESPAVAALAAR